MASALTAAGFWLQAIAGGLGCLALAQLHPFTPTQVAVALMATVVARFLILFFATDQDGSRFQTLHGTVHMILAVFIGPLLMILFQQNYTRWWFDWNLELRRFTNRVGIYLALMDDRYPSTDDHQAVHLDYLYPDVVRDLNRWLPLVMWLLAVPHYVVLAFLDIAAFVVVIVVWFVILFTGTYPQGMFDFVEGVIRWNIRVTAYAFTLVTDRCPPFRLAPVRAATRSPRPGTPPTMPPEPADMRGRWRI